MRAWTVALVMMAACGTSEQPAADVTYDGSWTGLCEHLKDCSCSPFDAVSACSSELEAGYEAGYRRAIEMGIAPADLEAARMTPELLSDIANTPCASLCEDAEAFSRATGR